MEGLTASGLFQGQRSWHRADTAHPAAVHGGFRPSQAFLGRFKDAISPEAGTS
jgi:hypothetical protein